MKYLLLLSTLLILAQPLYAQFSSPFKWNWKKTADGKLLVKAEIPPGHYLYNANTSIKVIDGAGKIITPESSPALSVHNDEFSGKVKIYPGGKKNVWTFNLKNKKSPFSGKIEFMGCKDKTPTSPALCFAPGTKEFTIGKKNTTYPLKAKAIPGNLSPALNQELIKFNVTRTKSGLLNAKELIQFLESSANNNIFANRGIFMVIIIIILGGFGLNLTPCVLPMIPINLAIIGAGEKADNKWQGFVRGGAYGIGIAAAYGFLGLLAVLAGTRFGTLNSSPWFNLAIAIVFIVLALAMFDVFIIDFSKYGAKLGPKDSQKGKIITAFLLGIVAALLAGACVAPVVIAVLLHSAQIYAAGNIAGLFLPFLLGIAMGLPWPFAGAGMAAIPKPGMWMVRIKQFFGVLIIFAALYYGYLAYTLLPIQAKGTNGERQQAKLTAALQQADKEHKPVFIDFWATWCKNCTYMEATTFKDPKVVEALKKFVVVKFQAEDMKSEKIKPVLDYFKIQGLPSFAILTPRSPQKK